jgi:multicomponent K+:H+ antiporter subunit F
MLNAAIEIAFVLVAVALALNIYRLLVGPDTTDRILALDTLGINTIALLVLYGISSNSTAYFEVALLLALLGFVGTVALCKISLAWRHQRMSTATEFIISALIILGALFVLLGSVGLARLPDFFMRLHGPDESDNHGRRRNPTRIGDILFGTGQRRHQPARVGTPCSFCSSPRRLRHTCWPRRRCTADRAGRNSGAASTDKRAAAGTALKRNPPPA